MSLHAAEREISKSRSKKKKLLTSVEILPSEISAQEFVCGKEEAMGG